MRVSVARRVPPPVVVAIVILGASLLTLVACNGGEADDWVVIHANRVEDSSTGGGPLDECETTVGLEVAYLPNCMFIEQGDEVGFANYYNNNNGGQQVKVELDATVFGVSEVTLEYQETKVLEVVHTPAGFFELNIKIPTGDHGGPVMIPQPPVVPD